MPDHGRIDALRRRVEADPTSLTFAALAEEYRRAGRQDEAIETCRRGLRHHPDYLSARVTLGRALIEVGRLEEAKVELERVVRAAPENLAAVRALAEIRRRRGEPSGGVRDDDAALDRTPGIDLSRQVMALEVFLRRVLAARHAPGAPRPDGPGAT